VNKLCWADECSIISWSDEKIPSSGSLVDCHSAINVHASREILKRRDLWFLSDTCKGYYGTRVPSAWSVFLVGVSKVSSVPLDG